MDPIALALVCAAAFLHAGWNFLVKGTEDPVATLWAAFCAALVLYAPVFLLRFPGTPIGAEGWLLILATGILHALYLLTLGFAYRAGELSAVYPLARGSAPLLVALLAAAILKERISPAGGAAILLVVGGIYLTHLEGFGAGAWLSPFRRLGGAAGRWALAAGLATALYSVVDKAGVARVPPEVYIYLMFALAILLTAPYALSGPRAVWVGGILRSRTALLRVAAGGACVMGAYLLVLFAMRLSKVSYVVAAREVSILIGAALGVFVLGEGGRRQKLLGASLVAAGLVLLALTK